MGDIVAIIGRPNVGKSTLFNRLTESQNAIVQKTSGVTRDRHYGKVEWNGVEFSIIDTGGYVTNSDDIFENEIKKQVIVAIEEATIILLLVDVTTGITDLDLDITRILRQCKKPILTVVNKVDNSERYNLVSEFYSLGLGDVLFEVSAINGSGTGELLDAIVLHIDRDANQTNQEILPRIAIIGKPNVGKSSLLNSLLGKERNIVTDISGTTRDSVDSHYNAFGFDLTLIDTAGIRKKRKVHEDIEFYSVLRSIRAIEHSDVCLFMIDAKDGIEKQDQHIYYVIEKNKKGVVILVNKWDLIDKDNNSTDAYEKKIREKIAPFTDVPIIFVSAINKQRVHKALETAISVFKNRTQRIATSKLNEIMLDVIANNPPPSVKGKYIKIKFITQLPTHAPSFAFFCNHPQYVREYYKRFLENQLRELFDFSGVPISIFMRQK